MRVYLSETRRPWRRREQSAADPPERLVGDHADRVGARLGVVEAMKRLPPRQWATLVCRFYQGLDVAQTAEILGCSTGTVKTQTSRGLATLRTMLGSALDPHPTIEVNS